MNAKIPGGVVKQRMDEGAMVIDVMTPEDYAACHVAGAQNACIYEVVFLERVIEFVPDRNSELIVYDATGASKAAEVARNRLLEAGYSHVFILDGGLSAWNNSGLPVERSLDVFLPKRVLEDGPYQIDIQNSRVEWIGRNLNSRHIGQLAILEGELVVAVGAPLKGRMTVDMQSLTNFDLLDPNYRDMLISHLKSEDFFAVDQFPTASLMLTGWEAPAGCIPEAPSWIATGELTIKDIRQPVRFPTIMAPQADSSIRFHAAFDIDRTLWDVLYGSCKYFERLGMHLVLDTISVELFVVARKEEL